MEEERDEEREEEGRKEGRKAGEINGRKENLHLSILLCNQIKRTIKQLRKKLFIKEHK
jgi:hypothetical protein